MARNLFTLLVGIDEYAGSNVRNLRGCVNDIIAMETFLEGRIATDVHINAKILLNEVATRQNIIDGFLDHLGQAGSEDVALFYFCGHGSQEPDPPEFWTLASDKLNETLVCYDSRVSNGWDLADNA